MAIQLLQGVKAKRQKKYGALLGGAGDNAGKQRDKYLIIRLPDLRASKLVAPLLFLLCLLGSFPWIGSILGRSLNFDLAGLLGPQIASDSLNFELLSSLFHDLKNEGILKPGQKALLLGNGDEDAIYNFHIVMENHLDVISANDFERQKAIPNETFDFVFANNFHENAEFIDRTLAIGGFAAIEMTQNPSFVFDKPLHYKIVYVRRFDSNIIAMRKLDNMTETNSATSRRLLSTLDEKKAALRNLEDVLLEPPRAASRRSRRYLKRTRYLPDLTGDTLESYPRRVFIDVVLPWQDKKATGTEWFLKNYPTRNLHFETYKIETVTEELSAAAREGVEATEEGGMSSWLRNNVKEEEYVVMKAEAEVVEEMLKSKAIRLVDELFLECRTKNKGQSNKEKGRSKAYWECLALYGRLRDEGVAVHQWWG